MTRRSEVEGMRPAEARALIADITSLWFPRTDLVGGFVTRRARRRHEEREAAAEAAHNARCADLHAIAELPDADLQWLLDIGWRPQW